MRTPQLFTLELKVEMAGYDRGRTGHEHNTRIVGLTPHQAANMLSMPDLVARLTSFLQPNPVSPRVLQSARRVNLAGTSL
jgi:hypothetical protein